MIKIIKYHANYYVPLQVVVWNDMSSIEKTLKFLLYFCLFFAVFISGTETKLWNCTPFWHPTDNQSRQLDSSIQNWLIIMQAFCFYAVF